MPPKPRVRRRKKEAEGTPPVIAAPPPPTNYRPGPEHKTHPGPWSPKGEWHPREPELMPCPTDLSMDEVEGWLQSALGRPECWDPKADAPVWQDRRWPSYLYWHVAGRGFFEAQRQQRKPVAEGPFTYKGYPADGDRVPRKVLEDMRKGGLLSAEELKRARRMERRKAGGQ